MEQAMSEIRFDPDRSAALRKVLVETAVADAQSHQPFWHFRRARGTMIATAALLGLVSTGGAAWAIGGQTLFFIPSSTSDGTATVGSTPDWPVNTNGQTYGVQGDSGVAPDLVLVVATNGHEGYALSTDMEAAEGTGFTSPNEALAWQEEHAGTYIEIPVCESDGSTVVGVFRIGDGDVPYEPKQ
jgi:hypothetical protein